MDEYRHELELQKQQREQNGINGVVLATMHSSKGLEYDAVFLPDVNEGIVPYKKAQTEEETEEERRMFYVALTRAIIVKSPLSKQTASSSTFSCRSPSK